MHIVLYWNTSQWLARGGRDRQNAGHGVRNFMKDYKFLALHDQNSRPAFLRSPHFLIALQTNTVTHTQEGIGGDKHKRVNLMDI